MPWSDKSKRSKDVAKEENDGEMLPRRSRSAKFQPHSSRQVGASRQEPGKSGEFSDPELSSVAVIARAWSNLMEVGDGHSID